MASQERLPRETSIDLVRGADVLLMLFVNEMAGVRGTPAFLLHKGHDVDGMTITDVVFPAFLFVTGLAIPFALGGRLRRGDTGGVWRHILTRTIALLAMGVLMVNAERPGAGGVISPDLWNVLMSVGVVLVWLAPPRDGPGRGQPWLRIAGAVLLVALLFLYRSRDATGLIQIRPQWWGILGLIGWSYLVAASAYVLGRDRPAVLLGLVALLFDVERINSRMSRVQLYPGQVLTLIDPTARVAVLTGPGRPPAGRLSWELRDRSNIPEVQIALQGQAAATDAFHGPVIGDPRFAAFVPTPRYGWVVSASWTAGLPACEWPTRAARFNPSASMNLKIESRR